MTRVVLLGAGHAHLEVLRRWARAPLTGVDATLVNPMPVASYTGMVPGYLSGRYAASALTIALEPLCARAGVRLVIGRATGVDVASRRALLGDDALPFDALSIDVGGEAAGVHDVPGAAGHAVALRPLANARLVRARMLALAPGAPAVVVGAGAAGVEVALALATRLRVTLLEAGGDVLAGYPPRARWLAHRSLARAGVAVRTGVRIVRVEPDAVMPDESPAVPSALTVWLAGTAAPAWLVRSALPRDGGGFLRVDATLRAVDGSPVWGAGDCAAIDGIPLPRAGVFAVRAAPTLAHNLAAFAAGGAPRRWAPRREVLAILDTADGRALLRWRGVALHGRAALWLKTWIDRRWIARF